MNRIKYQFKLILLAPLLCNVSGCGAYAQTPFTSNVYGNIANYFESEKDLVTFFNFKKGERVAEVGAGNGKNIVGLSLFCEQVSFTAQDIDAKILTQKELDAFIKKSKEVKPVNTCSFSITIGTENASGLTDNSYDKIILCSSFHEFSMMDAMLADLYKKLKPGGMLFILETKCSASGHKYYGEMDVMMILTQNKFKFLFMNGKDLNGSEGLYRMVFLK